MLNCASHKAGCPPSQWLPDPAAEVALPFSVSGSDRTRTCAPKQDRDSTAAALLVS